MIGGNINGILQLKSTSKNAIGEAVTSYTDTVVLKGFLDLMSGDVRRIVYSAKVQESTHIFICDYVITIPARTQGRSYGIVCFTSESRFLR